MLEGTTLDDSYVTSPGLCMANSFQRMQISKLFKLIQSYVSII